MMTNRYSPVLACPLLFSILIFTLCRGALSQNGTQPGFVGTFVMTPVASSLQTIDETARTVFTGTLYVSVAPPMWYISMDGISLPGIALTTTRRWSYDDPGTNPQYDVEYSSEMSYYFQQENALPIEGCCLRTPMFDQFTIPLVNEPFNIRYAGRSVVFKITSQIANVVNTSLVNEVISQWDDQVASDECPLRCLSPVDVSFVVDSSGSIDSTEFTSLKNFVEDFRERFFFTEDQNGARFALLQFAGYNTDNNNDATVGTAASNSIGAITGASPNRVLTNEHGTTSENRVNQVQRHCILNSSSAINDPTSPNQSDWGYDYRQITTPTLGYEFLATYCYDALELDGVPWYGSGGDVAWAITEAFMSGNDNYLDFSFQRWSQTFTNWDSLGGGLRDIRYTGYGTGIYYAAKEIERTYRGKQAILISLTDGAQNRGISAQTATPLAKERFLDALDGPETRFVSVYVGSPSNNSLNALLAAADGKPENVAQATNFNALDTLFNQLVSLSCAPAFDLCQGTCAGICSPCGNCICPTCPELECLDSLGCGSDGICRYEPTQVACCPSNIIEACERRGGEIRLEDCECLFNSGDGGDTGAVVGGTIGGLLAAVVLGVLALLLIVIGAVILVTAIILILKAQAIAAAIASLGSNAFGAGGSSSNPTYEGNTFEGDNPLFADSGL